MTYRLLLLNEDHPVTRFSLAGETTIGRSSDCTVQMLDTRFSRNHAVIEERKDGVWLRDTHSRNGTFLNGMPVTEAIRLSNEDRIQIGNHAFVFNPGIELLTVGSADSVILLPHTSVDDVACHSAPPAAPSPQALQVIHQMTLQLLTRLQVPHLLQGILEQVMSVFSADRGFILIRQSEQQWHAAAVKSDGRAMGLSQALLHRVIQSGAPIRFSNGIDEVSFAEAKSIVEHNLRSVMMAPLAMDDTLLGVIQIDTHRRDAYSSMHLQELAAITQTASLLLHRAKEHERTQQKLRSLEARQKRYEHSFVGSSPEVAALLTSTRQAARTDARILIEGESGTGKELIARMIHNESKRREGPFIAINCAAIPETLIESELFGHDKGAFTDATKQKSGAFELANNGTLFLDEVGELPALTQAKLLRVLQEQCFYRLGSERPTRVDIRIIAATNRNLAARVNEGCFRSDLFFRLNVVTLHIPPLRDRMDDLADLCAHILQRHAAAMGVSVPALSPAALSKLQAYQWPGNVRELQNTLERALVFLEGKELHPTHLAVGSGVNPSADRLPENLADALQEVEIKLIQKALQKTRGRKKAACERLGISRPTLDKKLALYGDALMQGSVL
ncbi:MAG: sigma 54-interacting transcriptional regulator [Deltaproteobacteria bacterium]|nr:sigma 54-interacting transcriptional regulator [Deltaproteobacteria bacterium]MBN2673143.1 sigma 54-interacting transcriptional regulator [Deltaproteobacteria bacterium]